MNNYKLTILIPVIDEKDSLKKTLEILFKENQIHIKKILFLCHKNKTTQESLNICNDYISKNKEIFKIIFQNKKNVGGAFIDSFEHIDTSHTVMMSSDLETDPSTVKYMIKESKKNTNFIISTTRWGKNSYIKDYGYTKTLLNYIFQKFFSKLFKTELTDLTFGFRLYPSKILKEIEWQMLNHSFFFESIIRPLSYGYKSIEVDTTWEKRIEGNSHNSLLFYYSYFKVAFKIYFKL